MAMKTRQLVRKHGWTSVAVDAKKIKFDQANWYFQSEKETAENAVHYDDIVEWCKSIVGNGNYGSTMQRGGGAHCEKRFVFKHAKHATLFRLKWL